MTSRIALAAALFAASLVPPAWAALPTGKLEFVQRTGTVAADETIPIVLRLTLDATSSPLTVTNHQPAGFAPEDIPTDGQFFNPTTRLFELRPFVGTVLVSLGSRVTCGGSFFPAGTCGPGADYRFEYNSSSSQGHPSVNTSSFALAPGASFEYTFGFFVPTAGGAAPAVYRWNGADVMLNFSGFDASFNVGSVTGARVISTGLNLSPGVAFERTVTAIPEPGTCALMTAGLFLVGGWVRRRRDAGPSLTAPASP